MGARPFTASTRLFGLINSQNDALRAPNSAQRSFAYPQLLLSDTKRKPREKSQLGEKSVKV
jgi:hypothetical protein